MLFRKLKQIKTQLFRRKRKTPSALESSTAETASHAQSTQTDHSYLQRRLNGSQKKYFDSADYFLKIHEVEKQTNSDTLPKLETIEEIKEPGAIPEKDPKSVPAAPLETAFSEIIDEMKSKEPAV
ncbi:hypothetical protein NECID01_1219 [Nematocida sp. AWRm77]|nr:hypothetical protein NECID01_1219 [Nematocida sp. AWRm77]